MALETDLFNRDVMLLYPFDINRYGRVDEIYSSKSFSRIQKELFPCTIDLVFRGDPVPAVSHTMTHIRNQTYLNEMARKIRKDIDAVVCDSNENVVVIFVGSDTRDYQRFIVKCLLFFASIEQRDLFRLTVPNEIIVD